jgi:hypothetical protein
MFDLWIGRPNPTSDFDWTFGSDPNPNWISGQRISSNPKMRVRLSLGEILGKPEKLNWTKDWKDVANNLEGGSKQPGRRQQTTWKELANNLEGVSTQPAMKDEEVCVEGTPDSCNGRQKV